MEDVETDPSDYSEDIDVSDTDAEFPQIQSHTRRNKPRHSLQCRHCSQIFFQNEQLMSHIASDHSHILNPNAHRSKSKTKSKSKSNRITKTKTKTKSKSKKKKKKKKKSSSTKIKKVPKIEDRSAMKNRNVFKHNSMQCRYCFQVFNENGTLMSHIAEFHSEDIKSSQTSNNSPQKAPLTPSDDDIASLLISPETINECFSSTNSSNNNHVLPIKLPKFDIKPINPLAIHSLSTKPLVTSSGSRKPFKANKERAKHNALQCRYCSRVFTQNCNLMDHIDAQHAEMIIHRRNVNNIKPQKRYRDIEWELPLKKKQKKEEFVDNEIMEDKKHKENKNGALENYNSLECRYCEEIFETNKKLMRHVKNEHAAKLKRNESKLRCDKCGLVFKSHFALNGHMNKHSKLRKRRREMAQTDSESESYSDYEEEYDTKRKNDDSMTMKGIRPKTWRDWKEVAQDTLLRCEYCTYCTNSTSHLKSHIMVHSGEKPFLCTLCPKKFRQKSHMRSHKRNHHLNT